MRCHMCNELLDEIEFHEVTGKVEPCNTCMTAIREAETEETLEDLLLESAEFDADGF